MFIYSSKQVSQESDDDVDDELVIIGLEVDEEEVGTFPTTQFDNSVHFPQPRTTLSGGQKYVILMPDSGLSRLYGDHRFEVYHEPAEIAKCMLDGNYLPPVVFGRGADPDLQERVFQFFDLDNRGLGADDEYRAQLREIAGMDDPEVEDEAISTRAEEIEAEYKYTELKTKASDMGIDNANKKKTELAEWVAEHEDE